jgi:hypothetical protein
MAVVGHRMIAELRMNFDVVSVIECRTTDVRSGYQRKFSVVRGVAERRTTVLGAGNQKNFDFVSAAMRRGTLDVKAGYRIAKKRDVH